MKKSIFLPLFATLALFSHEAYSLDKNLSINQKFLDCIVKARLELEKESLNRTNPTIMEKKLVLDYLIQDLKSNPEPLTPSLAITLDDELVNHLGIECNIQ